MGFWALLSSSHPRLFLYQSGLCWGLGACLISGLQGAWPASQAQVSHGPAEMAHFWRICEGGPRARLRSWAATRRVCGLGPLAGQARENQKSPLSPAAGKRQKPSFLRSRARGGACWRFWAAAGWLARALAGG
jgi:hypothetical protein